MIGYIWRNGYVILATHFNTLTFWRICMKLIFKNKLYILVTLVVSAILFYLYNNLEKEPVEMSPIFISDFSDDKELVGFSDTVFIGKVNSKLGTKKVNNGPETQFKVKVIEEIKGSLDTTVIVSQEGGYIRKQLFVMKGDKLIEEGKIYLFAGRYDEIKKDILVVPIHGKVEIEIDSKIPEFSNRFKLAHKNEKYYPDTKKR
ncbi:MAG: hypothetical protein K0S51_752 [Bacillales bacterium]|jgi:hypothetical protein|nr:hypothetical protein [Bacillales bacterium]